MATRPSSFVEAEPGIISLAIGAVGGMLLAAGVRDQKTRALFRVAGLALVGVAARPAIERALIRAGERRRTVRIRESIELERGVGDVFTFFKDFENFPRVFGGLKSVIDYEDGRAHWEAYTPSGKVIAWNTVITKYVPNCVIGWESVAGSPVETRNILRFTALGADRTRIDVETAYRPTETPWRDAVSALIGVSPEARLRAEMGHTKSYIENSRHHQGA
jgi:uncharacterized membrane protein